MTVVAIFLAVVLMFLFPIMSISERTDDISQLAVQTAVTEFVDDSRSIGKITQANYDKLVSALEATGNSYDIEIEVKLLDENVGKKTAWTSGTTLGENAYTSVFTSQVMESLKGNQVYPMKEGDILSCSVKNNNPTLSQTFRSAFYSISSKDTYQVGAQHSGIVTATAAGSN